MNIKTMVLAYACCLISTTIGAMDTATNIQDSEALMAAIQASRTADQSDLTLYNLMPKSDFINRDIYFQFDRGFYTRQNEHNVVTPTI